MDDTIDDQVMPFKLLVKPINPMLNFALAP